MEAATYQELSETIACILHCAAKVDFLQSFEQLKAANVQGTQEILSFSILSRVKPIHYISTLELSTEKLRGGYLQSKWVSDQIMQLARNRGLAVNIYRVPHLAGSSDTGAWNTQDFICQMIKGCIELSAVPKENYIISWTPVNFVSKEISKMVLKDGFSNDTIHFEAMTIMPFQKVIQYASKSGFHLKEISYLDWYTKLVDSLQQKNNVLHKVIGILDPKTNANPFLSYGSQMDPVSRQQLSAEIAPSLDHLLKVYFDYFARTGYLEIPKHCLEELVRV